MFIASAEQLLTGKTLDKMHKRGLNVYTLSQLIGVAGQAKDGRVVRGEYELPLWSLSISERIDIVRKCDTVLGIIAARMNKIGAMQWRVVSVKKDEDRFAEKMKMLKAIYDDYDDRSSVVQVSARIKIFVKLRRWLPTLKPDLSNFQKCLLMWRRIAKLQKEDYATEIEDWLKEPNLGTHFSDFIKMCVFDLHTHGNCAVYKESSNDRLENFYNLAGGTVFPVKSTHVGGVNAFIQAVPGIDPQMYFSDEMAFSRYLPSTAQSYGLIPLEALINKLAETMLFDRLAAERADGTKPPEKLVVFGQTNPFGSLDQSDFQLPIDENEQKRIETILNEERKNAVRTLTGHGTPMVLDLSRADTFGQQSQRQKDIRESVALVFNASNLEVNLTGSDDTSGRSTSESQERLDKQRGIYPILMIVSEMLNSEIIPYRFGAGYQFEYLAGIDEMADIRKATEKVNSGIWGVNEVRVEDLGLDPVTGEEFDKPKGGAQAQPTGTPTVSNMGL